MGNPKDTATITKELISLGASVIRALREESPEALDKLDEYTALFDEWKKSWQKGQKGEVHFTAKEREQGKRIAEQHSTVLELTEKMYRSVEESLRGLRGRSKGIRAYLDHFPSKISTIRTRKG
jgi:hypothetical protein